ncbi:insulin-like growth factor-binding protein-related protein 1 [Brevipalpus obovatus]|uniref:insulin-like growth factor-binding protein-related protein 1 n=1 Tax=Brevipalpus obovatus TaxID=246614 RepID=UPI003D9DFA49
MIKLCNLVIILPSLFLLTSALNCTRECIPDLCPPLVDCFAGAVRDRCDCCLVCGQKEGYRCFDPRLAGKLDPSYEQYGYCGENLECKIRTDLASDDPPEALCYCTRNNMICGTDGNTYDNICHLTEARLKRRDGLSPSSSGPCVSAPKIIQKPESINATVGSKIAFMCEVFGWPIPKISWKVLRKHSNAVHYIGELPSDDPHIVVQSRGGAKSMEMTSWLQIVGVKESDEGEYHCIVANDMGGQESYAVLTLAGKKMIKKRSLSAV